VPETAPPEKSNTAPSFWKRRVVSPIVHQLTQGITPEKIALTLAVGSACALFPILGTTTFLCLIVGIVLKLNQPIIQIVNGVCVPIHLPAILGCVRMGQWLFREPRTYLHIRYMNQMFWDDPSLFFHRFGVIALHASAAWALLLPVWIPLVYFIFLPVLRELDRMRAAAAAAKATAVRPPLPPPA
jgi:uncharacterized protein (DUF2062 family)